MSKLSPYQLLDQHTKIQTGTYFDHVAKLSAGVCFASSNRIQDSYWNFAFGLGTSKSPGEVILKSIRDYAITIFRNPYVYIATEEDRLVLETNAQYSVQSTEAWMTAQEANSVLISPNRKLTVRVVQTQDDMELFLQCFQDAYGVSTGATIGYGNLPPEYAQCLKEGHTAPLITTWHVLGVVDSQVVAVATTYVYDKVAALYNVGVIQNARRNGFGLAISSAALDCARGAGAKSFFLQTEPSSAVESMYEKLGFQVSFIGSTALII